MARAPRLMPEQPVGALGWVVAAVGPLVDQLGAVLAAATYPR